MKHHPTSKQRRGYAMVVVMMLILTTTAMAAVQMRQLNSTLRMEQARIRSEDRIRGPVTVLAIACSRLESGEPSGPDVSYHYEHYSGSDIQSYRVRYQETTPGQWTVSADIDPTAATLADLPAKF